jgi:peroxiredoxin
VINAPPGQRKDALLDTEKLARDDVRRIFALHHTGQTQAAQDLMDQVLNEPLGTVLFPVVLAYGAGCGLNSLPKNERLEQRFREAKITSIPCIGKL